jgi:hypothetical protein
MILGLALLLLAIILTLFSIDTKLKDILNKMK